jgi:hypothetical protein
MKKKLTLEDLEDYAFYQSGLSAHGCLNKLDSYELTAIKKYGRILLEKQKEIKIDEIRQE